MRLKEKKEKLISELIREGILKSETVINAFKRVPREQFVLPEYYDEAYEDIPLPIHENQTISAPHMVCIYCELLDLKPGLKVLEVGAGSGYQAALFAELVAPQTISREVWGHVYTIEIIPKLAEFATSNLKRTGYGERVTVVCADGSFGLPHEAPFDRISVAAASPSIPPPLLDQLSRGGKMLIPIGSSFFQQLHLIRKDFEGRITDEKLMPVAFVSLTGEYGRKW